MAYTWTCPYCGQPTTITNVNLSAGSTDINVSESRNSDYGLAHRAIQCPNPSCQELTLTVSLYAKEWVTNKSGVQNWGNKTLINTWQLMPRSRAKPIPAYVPAEIRQNYTEACLIVNDSPKASAAMSRRCLQGILRDFWEIPHNKRGNLGAEIKYIKDKIDADLYESIRAIREVGDIGAHMEKSVDTIVDVEPREAELLIELIETLISDWYIERYRRNERHSKLDALVAEKRKAKKLSKEAAAKIEDKSGTEDDDTA